MTREHNSHEMNLNWMNAFELDAARASSYGLETTCLISFSTPFLLFDDNVC